MIEVLVTKGKEKTATIDPTRLVGETLLSLVSEKAKKELSSEDIVSFDGKKATYRDGEIIKLSVPEEDLINQSITQWVQKHLKSKAKCTIVVSKQRGK